MNYALITLQTERNRIYNALNEWNESKKKVFSEAYKIFQQRLKDLDNAIELIQVGNVESIPLTKEDIEDFVFPSESTKAAFDKLTKK